MTAPISVRQHDRFLTRRGIFTGSAALLVCAPAIVRASRLMPLRQLTLPIEPRRGGFCERLFYAALDSDLRAGRMRTVLNGENSYRSRGSSDRRAGADMKMGANSEFQITPNASNNRKLKKESYP
jgi:hypothetical protein